MRHFKKTMIGVGALALSALPCSTLLADQSRIGVIGAVNQSASIIHASTKQELLELGRDIYYNEIIKTDDKGSAQVLFIDRSALTIGKNSELIIDKFVFDPASSTGELAMRGTKGAFRFVGGALSKKKPVKLKTPVSTIGIRGGIAIVEVDPVSGATDAIFAYGEEMTIENMNGDIQSTTVPGTSISVLTPTMPPTAPVKVEQKVILQKMDKMESESGQNGGATTVPSKETVTTAAATTSNEGSGDSGGSKQADSTQASSEDSGTDTASTTESSKADTEAVQGEIATVEAEIEAEAASDTAVDSTAVAITGIAEEANSTKAQEVVEDRVAEVKEEKPTVPDNTGVVAGTDGKDTTRTGSDTASTGDNSGSGGSDTASTGDNSGSGGSDTASTGDNSGSARPPCSKSRS